MRNLVKNDEPVANTRVEVINDPTLKSLRDLQTPYNLSPDKQFVKAAKKVRKQACASLFQEKYSLAPQQPNLDAIAKDLIFHPNTPWEEFEDSLDILAGVTGVELAHLGPQIRGLPQPYEIAVLSPALRPRTTNRQAAFLRNKRLT